MIASFSLCNVAFDEANGDSAALESEMLEFVARTVLVLLIGTLMLVALVVAFGADLASTRLDKRRRKPTRAVRNPARAAVSKMSIA